MINANNIHPTRHSYFYTVLFLNDFYPTMPDAPANSPVTKLFDITATSNSSNVKWLDEDTLWIRHNLPLPVTMQMWDETGTPILYVPILQKDVDSISIGNVVCEGTTSIRIDFRPLTKPTGNQVYKFAIRSLPLFDLKEQAFHLPGMPLDQKVCQQTGLAIVFRRQSLDALFDLIAEFDESYFHSFAQSYDLQYLTKESCYKNATFTTLYTNSLQDAIDLIDVNKYNIKYSWENIPPTAAQNNYGYN